MRTIYQSDYSNQFFNDKEQCEKFEAAYLEDIKRWKDNSSRSKLEKLIFDLKNAEIVHPSTIATCSFDAIAIKNMIRVCQKFAEDNKEYLSYY